MLRGSKPGERRGGRKRDTPNRRTILTDRILAIGLDHPKLSQHEFLLLLVRHQELPADTRMAIAPRCFPAKGAASSRTGRSRAAAGSRPAITKAALAKEADSEAPYGALAKALGASIQDWNSHSLDALFGIVQDGTTAQKVRRKAALKIAEYLLPKGIKKPKLLPDEYGFTVNANVAREYRDMQLEVRSLVNEPTRIIPANAERLKKLEARSEAVLRRLQVPCPTKYGRNEVTKDYLKVIEFIRLRDAKVKLTEAQSAEEAHLKLRYDVFAESPESVARRRRKALWDVERRFKESRSTQDPGAVPLSRKDRNDLKLLQTLYPERKGKFSKEADAACLADRDEMFSRGHPFQIEAPAADGNFYPRDPKLRPAAAADDRAEIQGDAQSDDADDGDINFKSWLRGEVKYPPHALRAAAKTRFSRTYPMTDRFKSALIEDLVLEEKLVPEDQVCAELARYLPNAAAQNPARGSAG